MLDFQVFHQTLRSMTTKWDLRQINPSEIKQISFDQRDPFCTKYHCDYINIIMNKIARIKSYHKILPTGGMSFN